VFYAVAALLRAQRGPVPEFFRTRPVRSYTGPPSPGASVPPSRNAILSSLLCHDLRIVESQCGFCCGRSTIDMIFFARLLQEKCREKSCDFFFGFHRPIGGSVV